MSYKLETTPEFDKQLKKLDKFTRTKIASYLLRNIKDIENPRSKGKALVGNKKGYWRYRVGQYRVIVDIQDEKLVILALEIGHRKDIYK